MEPARKAAYGFRQLGLWQKAQAFAVEVARFVDGLPRARSCDVAGLQLVRSATSVAANIAEGHGRFSLAAYRNHLSIAKGSACEALSWLDLLSRLGHAAPATEPTLETRCEELVAALTRRIRDLEQRERELKVREAAAEYDVEPPERDCGSRVPGLQG